MFSLSKLITNISKEEKENYQFRLHKNLTLLSTLFLKSWERRLCHLSVDMYLHSSQFLYRLVWNGFRFGLLHQSPIVMCRVRNHRSIGWSGTDSRSPYGIRQGLAFGLMRRLRLSEPGPFSTDMLEWSLQYIVPVFSYFFPSREIDPLSEEEASYPYSVNQLVHNTESRFASSAAFRTGLLTYS